MGAVQVFLGRHRKETIVSIFLVFLLFLAYIPLQDAVSHRNYPEGLQVFFPSIVSSEGPVYVWKEYTILGNLEGAAGASTVWRSSIYTHPYFSDSFKKATSSYLLINENAPTSTRIPRSTPVFVDENFAEGWVGINYATLTAEGGTLTIAPGEDGWVNVYRQTPTYTGGDYLVKLKVAEINNAALKLLMTADGSQGLLTDINGEAQHTKPGTYTYYLAGGHQYETPSFTVQDTTPDVKGMVKIDSINIDMMDLASSSRAKITLNGHLIFDEPLTFPLTIDSYTTRPLYEKHFIPPGRAAPYLKIPFDISLLKPDNEIVIGVDGQTTWTITFLMIWLSTSTQKASPPLWTLYIPVIFSIFAVEVFVLTNFAGRFYRWIKSLGD